MTAVARPQRPPDAVSRDVSSLIQLRTLSRAMLRGFFRDRTAMFFTFLFPLMFLVVLGLIFGSGETQRTKVGVVGTGPVVSALPEQVLEIEHFDSFERAVDAVRSGDLPAAVMQRGDQVVVRFAASDQVASATVVGVIQSVVGEANVEATGEPPRYSMRALQVEDDELDAIEFLTPGILSWGIATAATFGAALTLVAWRRKQILRRVRLSPTPVWAVVGARVGVSLVVAFVQAVLFVGVAMLPVFGLQLTGQWWLAIPLLALGTLAFLSVGLLVGAVTKTEEAASAVANFVVLPMAFLSGTFFDIEQAPPWLQGVSQVLPLRHLNDAMLDVLVREQGASAIVVPCAVLAGFAIVVTFLATRFFSWDDR